jgi:hypothetical protein
MIGIDPRGNQQVEWPSRLAGIQPNWKYLPTKRGLGISWRISRCQILHIVQKFHAVTDPPEPPISINDRAHDLVDLLLLRRAFYLPCSSEQLLELRRVAMDVFDARAQDAETLGLSARKWPPRIHVPDHWREAYQAARDGVGRDSNINAASKISPEVRNLHPRIDWKDIVGIYSSSKLAAGFRMSLPHMALRSSEVRCALSATSDHSSLMIVH